MHSREIAWDPCIIYLDRKFQSHLNREECEKPEVSDYISDHQTLLLLISTMAQVTKLSPGKHV